MAAELQRRLQDLEAEEAVLREQLAGEEAALAAAEEAAQRDARAQAAAAANARAARKGAEVAEAKHRLAVRRAVEAAAQSPEWRDWGAAAGEGLPAEVVAKVAGKLNAVETRGCGSAVLAVACKGWREALKRDAIARAAGRVAPEDWRDWGGRLGIGLPAEVLQKVAEKVVAQNEAGWAAWRRERHNYSEEEIEEEMAERKRYGNCLFAFARVCKEWRKAQLKVGGPLRTRVESDVLLPGSVALAKWALAEGCPREDEYGDGFTMANLAADHGHRELVTWLCGEGGYAMDEGVMTRAAMGGNLELVQWLRAEGCPWDYFICFVAVQQGHVEVLRWARENGCEWDAGTRDWAAEKLGYSDALGNLHMFQ